MTILMISEVVGQTAEGYDQMLALVETHVRTAPGFISHAAYADGDTWRLVEMWQTKQQCDHFFIKHIVQFLPEGIRPKRSYHTLHKLLLPAGAARAE